MLSKILVPLDGSELSEAILPFVRSLAADTGAEVILLRVVSTSVLAGSYTNMVPMPVMYAPPPLEPQIDLRAQAEGYLQRVAFDRLPDQNVIQEVCAGPTVETILAFAEGEKVSLIAMTTHGRGGLSRMMIGSVADEIVRRSSVPVLLVRPQ